MNAEWIEREALITVKAYPNPSSKYHETVCVAAITREEGWVRLYPVNFRSMPIDQRFHKYQLVKFRMQRQTSDPRPESYRPDELSIQLGHVIKPDDGWNERWRWIRPTIGPTMCDMISLQDREKRSLACIRPRSIIGFEIAEGDKDWSKKKQETIDQMLLFDQAEKKLEKIPWIFRYEYLCESPNCHGHKQSIIDWELMELYRGLRTANKSEDEVRSLIRQKYLDELCSPKKDTHFFVGNHSLYPKSFMVLGVFWPPRTQQTVLF